MRYLVQSGDLLCMRRVQIGPARPSESVYRPGKLVPVASPFGDTSRTGAPEFIPVQIRYIPWAGGFSSGTPVWNRYARVYSGPDHVFTLGRSFATSFFEAGTLIL